FATLASVSSSKRPRRNNAGKDESWTRSKLVCVVRYLPAGRSPSCAYIACRCSARTCTSTQTSFRPRATRCWSAPQPSKPVSVSSLLARRARVAMWRQQPWLASWWLKKPRLLALKPWRSIVPVSVTTAALRPWLKPRVKPASSFKRGLHGQDARQECCVGGTRRRSSREDDRSQPCHESREGRSNPRFRSTDRGGWWRRTRSHG